MKDLETRLSQADWRFEPGFTDRVLRRLKTSQRAAEDVAVGFEAALGRLFPRLALPALAVAVGLLLANALTADDFSLISLFGVDHPADLTQTSAAEELF